MQNQSKLNAVYCAYDLSGEYRSCYSYYRQPWRTIGDLHYHDCAEFGLCLEGDGIFFVEDRIYPFSCGVINYIPAGTVHIAQSPDDRQSVWEYIFVDTGIIDHSLWSEHETIAIDSDCRMLFCMMRDAMLNGGGMELYGHLCAALAIKSAGLGSKLNDTCSEFNREMILPAIRYISERFAEDISVPELAYQCSVSESTLRRAFKNVSGKSPSEYITEVRITMAENLLINTDLPVLEVSERAGFPVLSSFNRQFRKKNLMPPSLYRTQKRKT